MAADRHRRLARRARATARAQVAVLATGDEAPQYPRRARSGRWTYRRDDRAGARLPGPALRICCARPTTAGARRGVWALQPALAVRAPATFHSPPTSARRRDWRSSICAARAGAASARSRCRPGAPFGTHRRQQATRARCAWPASAPARTARCWTTRRCRSCASSRRNACNAACARAPVPRTRSRWSRACSLTPKRKQPRVLNEAAVFNCIALRQAARHAKR